MSRSEGDELAPVTYLFGAATSARATAASAAGVTPPATEPEWYDGDDSSSSPSDQTAPSHADRDTSSSRGRAVSADSDRVAPVSSADLSSAAEQWPVPVIGAPRTAAFAAPAGPAFRDESESANDEAKPTGRRDGSFDRISNVSMQALARRGVSSGEMRDLLKRREFEGHDIEIEVERLESVGLLDDEELATVLVTKLRERKGFGRTAIVAELRRRKVDPDAIEVVLADGGDDELARATEIAIKRAPQLRSLEREVAKRRLSGFLMRKGYSGAIVSNAVARALEPSGPVFR